MSLRWLGNARIPPQTMQDLSDEEWFHQLREKHGDHLHVGEPQDAGGHSAGYWEARGMIGLYLDVPDSSPSEAK